MAKTVATFDQRVTVYRGGPFGYSKIECRKVVVERRPYAQYPSATTVRYFGKGKRRERGCTIGEHPRFVVVNGWGHPELTERYTRELNSLTTRHGMYSEQWEIEFASALEVFVKAKGATVLLDTRDW